MKNGLASYFDARLLLILYKIVGTTTDPKYARGKNIKEMEGYNVKGFSCRGRAVD